MSAGENEPEQVIACVVLNDDGPISRYYLDETSSVAVPIRVAPETLKAWEAALAADEAAQEHMGSLYHVEFWNHRHRSKVARAEAAVREAQAALDAVKAEGPVRHG